MKLKNKETATAFAVIVPMTAYYLLFTLVPLIMLFWYSFTNYNVMEHTKDFILFKNFIKIFSEPIYYQSLITTLLLAVLIMVFGMFLGFILAYFLYKVIKCKSFLRVIWYIPALLPMAVMSQFISIMIEPSGTINKILIDCVMAPIEWTQSVFWMYFYIVTLITWKGLGSTAILFLAGLNGISKDVYEAAKIDGARGLTLVTKITLPLMRPMIGFILITGFIGAFNIFEPVQLISKGGPKGQTEVILFKIYTQGFDNFKLGFASALSVVVFVVVLVLTFINMKITDSNMLKAEV